MVQGSRGVEGVLADSSFLPPGQRPQRRVTFDEPNFPSAPTPTSRSGAGPTLVGTPAALGTNTRDKSKTRRYPSLPRAPNENVPEVRVG